MSRFINPFTDFGFKKLFGEEANKDICIDFLNALISDQNILDFYPLNPTKILDITYQKNESFGEFIDERKVVFDLLCETQSGEKIIVEMQKAKQHYFKDRTLFYTSRLILEQGKKREEDDTSQTWKYRLLPVYCVSIMDFRFDENKKNGQVVHNIMLTELETKTEIREIFYDKLRFIYLEMPNAHKKLEELDTKLDKWFYLLKHLPKLEEIPQKLQEKIFMKLFEQAEIANYSVEQWEEYQESLKKHRDLYNVIEYAKDKQKEEFEVEKQELNQIIEKQTKKAEEERKKAEEERKKAEEERKKAEEEKEKNHTIVKNLKAKNMSVEFIMEITGLSKQEIEHL